MWQIHVNKASVAAKRNMRCATADWGDWHNGFCEMDKEKKYIKRVKSKGNPMMARNGDW